MDGAVRPVAARHTARTIIGAIRRSHLLTHLAIDGWSLVRQPNSPAALYLLEWVAALSTEQLELTVLHPRGALPPLPPRVGRQAIDLRPGAWGRLRYEQLDLPRAAASLQCESLLVLDGGAPIAARIPTAALRAERPTTPSSGVIESLQRAAGRAGRSVAELILYPGDAPPAAKPSERQRGFRPFVSSGFSELSGPGPQVHVLCFGLQQQQVALALAAWSWVDGSLGDTYPLLFLGIEAELEQFIRIAAEELDLTDSIEFRPEVDLATLPLIYHAAAAYLGLGLTAAWGQPLRWALAAGVPVAAVQQEASSSILGDAGYLAPPGDARALGAACLSLLVQEQLAEKLRERGRRIASSYFAEEPVAELRSVLGSLGRN